MAVSQAGKDLQLKTTGKQLVLQFQGGPIGVHKSLLE